MSLEGFIKRKWQWRRVLEELVVLIHSADDGGDWVMTSELDVKCSCVTEGVSLWESGCNQLSECDSGDDIHLHLCTLGLS